MSSDTVFRIQMPFWTDFWTKEGNVYRIVCNRTNRRDLTLSCCLTETLTKQVPKRWLVCYWRKVSFLCIFQEALERLLGGIWWLILTLLPILDQSHKGWVMITTKVLLGKTLFWGISCKLLTKTSIYKKCNFCFISKCKRNHWNFEENKDKNYRFAKKNVLY